jgi:hypothetical protein
VKGDDARFRPREADLNLGTVQQDRQEFEFHWIEEGEQANKNKDSIVLITGRQLEDLSFEALRQFSSLFQTNQNSGKDRAIEVPLDI